MPKTINTKRDELVCGKIDILREILINNELITALGLLREIQYDCVRMEQKLITRKEQVQRLSGGTNENP